MAQHDHCMHDTYGIENTACCHIN